ncbi:MULTISPECIES: hypothetical protein [unclassified Streptomyces]|uniref:hypothetical protein n=1 Tax=unclassified Streptomyces TaxID=2593676 RepID=UPI0022531A9E|nr:MULTISPECIES: hypothetical protein [unclassified Streptomyces]MCX4405884.1 hypothetical protein [Streptomyces sp. NBC_01764]MCX5189593.1 hypothetical protein [Streptomyces sp. NBC_00268]
MASQPGEPRKVRWTVPAADTSVIEWLNVQADISQSLRQLIRESIQRDGYVDVYYKPVEQLPRRGRPPLESTEQHEDDEAVTERRPAAMPVQPQPVVTDQADAVVKKTAPAPVAQPEPVPAPVETAEEPAASAPSAPPEPPKQASIDEIMASTRR